MSFIGCLLSIRLVGALIRVALVLATIWAGPARSQSVLELPPLMAEALAKHPTTRSQHELVLAARAGVDAARWQFWPTPSVAIEQAEGSAADPSLAGDRRVAVLRLQQPLWTGGRLTANLDRAQARGMVAQADLEIVRQQLSLRVLQGWVDAVAANLKVLAHERSLGAHEQLFALVRRRAGEGVSAQADVDLARSRLEAVRAELAGSRAQRDSALERLVVLAGRPAVADRALPVTAELTLPGASDPGRPPAVTLQAALAVSPQYAKAQAQARVAEADVESARAARWPEVSLRLERQHGERTRVGAAPQSRVFIGLNSSFGAGLSTWAGIDAALAQQRAALEEVQAQQRAIEEQVRVDLVVARVAADRRASLLLSRQSASDVSESWRRQFLAGRKQWQELMNAEREVVQADAQLADAIGAELLSSWRLAILTAGVDALLRPDEARLGDADAMRSGTAASRLVVVRGGLQ